MENTLNSVVYPKLKSFGPAKCSIDFRLPVKGQRNADIWWKILWRKQSAQPLQGLKGGLFIHLNRLSRKRERQHLSPSQQDYLSGAHASYRRVHLRSQASRSRSVRTVYGWPYSKSYALESAMVDRLRCRRCTYALLSFLIVWKTVVATRKSSIETTSFSGGTSILWRQKSQSNRCIMYDHPYVCYFKLVVGVTLACWPVSVWNSSKFFLRDVTPLPMLSYT